MSSNSHGYRLPEGGLIDRSCTLAFTYNGARLQGHPGDTVASALIANGISIISRSLKYHRPRGFYGAALEDPNSIVSVRDGDRFEPAVCAGHVSLADGMEVRSVAGWPSPEFDLAAGAQLASKVLSAGFYYKTFKWPHWKLFEPWIRRAAGYGKPEPAKAERDTLVRHATCDVLIVGGGPAGLAAARALATTSMSIVFADDQLRLGGSLNWETATIGGKPGSEWAKQVAAELADNPRIKLMTSTAVTSAYEGNVFTLVQAVLDERGSRTACHWKIRARHVVLAAGMIDRPLLSPGNDRPGIMLSASVRRLIGEFGVAPSNRIAIYTNNDSGYLTAIAAARANIEVAGIIDTRPEHGAIHARAVQSMNVPAYFASRVVATRGYKRLSSITISDSTNRTHTVPCSSLALAGGWTPLIQLAGHLGFKPAYDERRSMFVVRDRPANWHIVGGASGKLDLKDVIADGQRAAAAVASSEGARLSPASEEEIQAQSLGTVLPGWHFDERMLSSVWIDLQNDVKASDVVLAAQENYTSVEHLKRYTTLGMGMDQGRTSNVNGLALLGDLTGQPISAMGTTTFRPPYAPVRMGTIAGIRRGDLFQPRRRLPAHDLHKSLGGVFEDFGWERPDWYERNGADRESAVLTEMVAVREKVGLFDGSSLGKIEIAGPDARQFVSRFYVSDMATLKPGRVRYSLMLKDDGIVFDDGVVACLAENHFLACPTSGNADAVLAWFERWRQTEWPWMKVAIAGVTSQWATIALSGPRSRDLLARLSLDFDISRAGFSHMQVREGLIQGVVARVMRVSFTGELQYEISVPSRYGASLLQELLSAGGELGARAVGMEAWLRLRLEKGYLHVGSDTNGRTTPLDFGMARQVAMRKNDFIGKRSLTLSFAQSAEREQLVGLVAIDDTVAVGSRILSPGHRRTPCPTEGYVTSACFSPTLKQSIGLALLERGHSREGEIVSAYHAGKITRCRISKLPFYDPENKQLST